MQSLEQLYVSPVDQSPLKRVENCLVDHSGNRFPIDNEIPNLIFPADLPQSDQDSIDWYKDNAAVYDDFLPLTFETFGVSEDDERAKMIDALDLNEDSKVLETGCGTGRDSEKIASRLSADGELFIQDISREILDIAVRKFKQNTLAPKINISLANGYYLPFEDNCFDRAFHFGGLNTFGDIKRGLSEMVRVTKPGGRIVVGDENMPAWLRETDFGRVLMNSNPHYKYDLPLEYLPVEARNVKVEWIIGGVFYFISFDVGEGVPEANIDFEIPGVRGGTHRTRYYGHIEGVTPEAVELARAAREKSGKSMHLWLDEMIKREAKKELSE